jgi:hypothetical protein
MSDVPVTVLPSDADERKAYPICTGLLDYFPDALAAIANVSVAGSVQHHPGQGLFWDRAKPSCHADSLLRHLVDRGQLDKDNKRHSAKAAWHALALLQTEIETERAERNGTPIQLIASRASRWPGNG